MPASHRSNWRLTGTPAVVVTGCAMGVAVLGSTIPSGLYTHYERLWSLPVSSTTHVFAMYILGVLVALIGLGHLADHIGRLPVMIGALVLSLASSA